ncbi:TIGR01212 family radical SAM protein [Streptococcus thermophilus]|uniref:TIGR01212 family radical SAM protein n=1 Tax=Streptococcus thermophilus TaxID=1308 RepID=UPI002629E0DF|nr:TIGR01212 family radical SAM protein [Streptococcus thermophilus]
MKKRYRTVNDYYREIFGEKIFKLPIDAGFDCPNRDGTVAHGGCTFCTVSGSGDAIVAPEAPIREQFYHEIDFMHRKWPEVHKYLVYFQNFTNTHAPLEVIKDRYEQAINEPGVVGINIGTRPDCLPDDVIDYLAELTDRMHVTVELGLQTTYEETSELINRAHSYELHLLHLMTNTRMQRDYHEGGLKLLSQEEYVSIICDQLEIIPKDIVIHRITGDAPRDMLIGPMWSLNKWEVLNAIDKEMERRDSWQGCKESLARRRKKHD